MEQYEFIRTGHRVYGKSIKKLSKETGHSRNTIRKMLRGEYQVYQARERQPFPVLAPYKNVIDEWLKQDKDNPKKQRHTARRVYNRLVEEYAFQGSEATVRRYVRQIKAKSGLSGRGAFIPLSPYIGQEVEVDWGRAKVVINNEEVTCKLFCMRSKYSGKSFVRLYKVERQQCLFDAHMHAFGFFNGVFRRFIYDNMSTVVLKVLRGKARVEQDAFIKFRSYYNFEPRFCTPGEGHEKGGVEGLVGFARRNFLVPIPKGDSLEDINEYLLQRCIAYGEHIVSGRTQTVNQLFEQEKAELMELPKYSFENTLCTSAKVDHYSTVLIEKNRYSVPSSYVGLRVCVNLTVSKVDVFYEGKKIAWHNRLYAFSQWSLNPDHYLDLLEKRPGAFDTARPIKQWRHSWPNNFEHLLFKLRDCQGIAGGTKDFITVLQLYRKFKADDVTRAIEISLKAGVSSGEAIRHILAHEVDDCQFEPLTNWSVLPNADVSVYNQLGGLS